MQPDRGSPGGRYEDLVDELVGIPGVTPPERGSGFGRSAVRFNGKIFVMFVRGRLVLKLPQDRVDELVAAGSADRFDANKGTPMREWASLDPESGQPWLPLAREALTFAQAQPAMKAGSRSR
ncbi:MAG TPA: hypothetical protein VF834_11780 [Streptosporangiaceae bacterium]